MEKRVAVVTGASAGMGVDIARELASKGFHLAIGARRVERLKELKAEIETSHPGLEVLALACDVTSDESVTALFQKTREKFGRIDAVFANAGFGVMGTVEKLTLDDFRRQDETNVYGVIRTIKASMEDIKKTKGHFCLIGSGMSYIPMPGTASYCMSKFAVRALADCLRFEMKAHGVSVTLICPGFINTELRKVNSKGTYRSDAKDPVPAFLMMSSKTAGKKIVRATLRKRPEKHLTMLSGMGVFFIRHCPWLVRFFLGLTAKHTTKLV